MNKLLAIMAFTLSLAACGDDFLYKVTELPDAGFPAPVLVDAAQPQPTIDAGVMNSDATVIMTMTRPDTGITRDATVLMFDAAFPFSTDAQTLDADFKPDADAPRLDAGFADAMPIDSGILPPSLVVSLAQSNPRPRLFAAGTQGASLAAIEVCAGNNPENIELDTVQLTPNVTNPLEASAQDYSLVYVADENGQTIASYPSTAATGPMPIPPGQFVIVPGSCRTLFVKANLAPICPTCPIVGGGHRLGFHLADTNAVSAHGQGTHAPVQVSFGGNSPDLTSTHLVYRAIPVGTFLPLPIITLQDGNQEILRFTVQAVSGTITWRSTDLSIWGNGGVRIGNVELLDVTYPLPETLSSSVAITPSEVRLPRLTNASSQQEILDGEFRIFSVRADLSGVVSGATIQAGFQVDAFPPSNVLPFNGGTGTMGSFDNIWSEGNHLIWCDGSGPATHTPRTPHWTNGYLVFGFQDPNTFPVTLTAP